MACLILRATPSMHAPGSPSLLTAPSGSALRATAAAWSSAHRGQGQGARLGLRELACLQGAWRGRQNASSAIAVVDNFFTSVISTVLAHDVQAKDLDLPLHSARTHDLLAENTAAMNMSYTVY